MGYEAFIGNMERDFTLTCPGPNAADPRVREIVERGNLPLLIDDEVIAEIRRSDLAESWAAALELSAVQLRDMTKLAGSRLADVMDAGLAADNLTDLVSDAAVLFLLTLRRNGFTSSKRIPACRVKWIGQLHSEQFSLLRDGTHA